MNIRIFTTKDNRYWCDTKIDNIKSITDKDSSIGIGYKCLIIFYKSIDYQNYKDYGLTLYSEYTKEELENYIKIKQFNNSFENHLNENS